MTTLARAAVCLGVIACAGRAGAEETSPPAPRPRLVLALSGGGARGIAHVGVLQAFEERGIPVDGIVGTSMGAVVGGIYATGHSANDLERIVQSLDWESIFSGEPDRRLVPVGRREDRYRPFAGLGFDFWDLRLPGGLLAEYRVNRFLIEHLAPAGYAAGGDFDALPIPFRAVAAALEDGRRVVIDRGDLARAVRASMSIPLALPPVDWGGRPLVDGGIVDNLPVAEACRFEADLVVAVDARSAPLEADEYRSAFGVASQVSNVLTERANDEFASEPDVLVTPDLGKHGFNDYTGLDRLVARGREAALAAIPEIEARLGEALRRAGPPRPTPERRLEGTPIAEIQVRGNERLSERVIRRTFSIPLGPPFDLDKGLNAFDRIHATGFFDHLWLDLEPVAGGLRIVLVAEEGAANRIEVGAAYNDAVRARGLVRLENRNTLGFGEETSVLLVASDGEEVLEGRLAGERLLTWVAGFEAKARVFTEKPRFYVDGESANRARFVRRDARFALRRAIKRSGLLEAGFAAGSVKTWARPGLPFPDATDEVRRLDLAGVFDGLDDRDLPSTGLRLAALGDVSLPGAGASLDYWRGSLSGTGAFRVGRRGGLRLDGFVGLSEGDVPAYDEFRIGGPVLLPGYRTDQIWGRQALAGAVSFRYRLVGRLLAIARAGAGQVFEARRDLSLASLEAGIGLSLLHPSRIGPLAADLGVRRDGGVLLTFSIGYP